MAGLQMKLRFLNRIPDLCVETPARFAVFPATCPTVELGGKPESMVVCSSSWVSFGWLGWVKSD